MNPDKNTKTSEKGVLVVMDNNDLEAPTPREIEVVALLQEGCTNQEIAARLGITLNTVEFHLKNIFKKLGVSNRLKAVQKAQYLS